MKKLLCCGCLLLLFSGLCSCQNVTHIKDEVFNYVNDNLIELNNTVLSKNEDVKFFDYKSTGLSVGGVYYGYYFSQNDTPSFYEYYWDTDANISLSEVQDGWQWNRPNNGEDWYFTQRICKNWFYYEMHG